MVLRKFLVSLRRVCRAARRGRRKAHVSTREFSHLIVVSGAVAVAGSVAVSVAVAVAVYKR